jgi:predicted DNA-binding antitoxin AbrB/MazE fold protein
MAEILIKAVYTNGVLKPASKLDLPEGSTVEVHVKPLDTENTNLQGTFSSLQGIWSHLSDQEVDKIEYALHQSRRMVAEKGEELGQLFNNGTDESNE